MTFDVIYTSMHLTSPSSREGGRPKYIRNCEKLNERYLSYNSEVRKTSLRGNNDEMLSVRNRLINMIQEILFRILLEFVKVEEH